MRNLTMEMKTYKRCELIIRQFMSVEKPTADLLTMFHEWLLDGRHCREKNLIVRRLFDEALSDLSPAPSHPNDIPASEKQFLEKLPAVKKIY